MSGRFAISSIAGVDLTDLADRDGRIDVLDGEGLKSNLTGSSKQALDFSVHTQLTARAQKGVHWGAHAALLPIERVNEVVAAIEAAMNGAGSFEVVAHDQSGSGSSVLHDISATCVPDYAQASGKVFTHGRMSSDYVADVIFRFITL